MSDIITLAGHDAGRDEAEARELAERLRLAFPDARGIRNEGSRVVADEHDAANLGRMRAWAEGWIARDRREF